MCFKINGFILFISFTLISSKEQLNYNSKIRNNTNNDNIIRNESIKCVHYKYDDESIKLSYYDSGENFALNATNNYCSLEHQFCYSLWKEDLVNNSTSLIILAQGCWDGSSVECLHNECVSTKMPSKALNYTKFCCCSGDMCNANLTERINLSDLKNNQSQESSKILVISLCTLFIFVFILFALFVYRLCFSSYINELDKKKKKFDSLNLVESGSSTSSTNLSSSNHQNQQSQSSAFLSANNLERLKLQELIYNGRYGSVWKGVLNDELVAVKLFTQQNKQLYLNERDIYMLPFMDHLCLPKIIGADEKQILIPISSSTSTTANSSCASNNINNINNNNPYSNNNNNNNSSNNSSNNKNNYGSTLVTEYRLVLTYASNGCMQEFLRENTIDWLTLCSMIISITSGLQFLHTKIEKGKKLKPCIVHRDLSSRNILVTKDKRCLICDFGLSIQISDCICYFDGNEINVKTSSLPDVGTLRYMAPEVLEGTVNLGECETSLKQVDVYALGLIIWETASRCTDLYQGIEVPPYKQPYEAEIGPNPSYEQMQMLVTRHRARPLFPDVWKDSNPAIKTLKETIEDCWDYDAEARLTADGALERLLELPTLWERYKSGTVTAIVGSAVAAAAATAAVNGSQANVITNLNTQKNLLSLRNEVQENSTSSNNNSIIVNEKLTNKENDLLSSSEETRELTLSSSDSERNSTYNKTAATVATKSRVTLPLQPYQGRNPCLERNLMLEKSDDNEEKFLHQGFKFRPKCNDNSLLSPEIQDINDTNENESLVTNDLLNRYRPYQINTNMRRLHNHLNVGNGISINNNHNNDFGPTNNLIQQIQNDIKMQLPKKPNLPGNGYHHSISSTAYKPINNSTNNTNNHNSCRSTVWPSKIINLWTKTNNLKNLFVRKKRNQVSNECDTLEVEPLSSSQQQQNTSQYIQPSLQLQQQPNINHNNDNSFENSLTMISNQDTTPLDDFSSVNSSPIPIPSNVNPNNYTTTVTATESATTVADRNAILLCTEIKDTKVFLVNGSPTTDLLNRTNDICDLQTIPKINN